MGLRALQTVLCLVMVTATGCFSPRTESLPLHTFQLAVGEPSGESPSGGGEGPVLLVSPTQPEPGFDTPRMVYLTRRYELEYYGMNQWADVPARMFTPLLVEALSRARAWRAVVGMPSSIRGDFRLDSHGFAVQQEFLEQPSRARVAVRVQLVDLKESSIVGTRVFEATENAPSEDPYGGVQAANRALAVILDRIASWLQSCARHAPDCSQS